MKKTELLEQLTVAIRRKHYSLATERTYRGIVARFWDFSLAHLWVLWVTPEMTLAQARLSLSLGVLPPGLSHWPVIRRAG